MMRLTTLCGTLLLLLSPGLPLQAQEDSSIAHSSFGLRIGKVWTAGDWRNSPIAPDLEYFGGGFCLEGDLELAVGRAITLGLEVEVTTFDGSEWERFAASRGSRIEVSARMILFSASLRPHIRIHESFLLKLDIGPAFALSEASERFAGMRFVNNSLGSSIFGASGGCEVVYRVSRDFGFSAKWGLRWFPSGLSYGRGDAFGILWLPVVAGVRLSF